MDSPRSDWSLTHMASGAVMGIRVRIRASHAAALTPARRLLDEHPHAADAAAESPIVELNIYVAGRPDSFPRQALGVGTWLLDVERLVMIQEGVIAVADVARRNAVVYVEPSVIEQTTRLHEQVLRPLALFLVTWQDRCPLHCSAVADGTRTLALVGSSGAGKSSLAYAALQDGMRVLADDAVYVQRRPQQVLWSISDHLQLRPEALRFFPELGSHVESGTTPDSKIRIPLPHPPAPVSGPVGLCFLQDRAQRAQVRRIGADAAVAAVQESLDPGFDRFRDAMPHVVRALSAGGAWQVVTGSSPQETWRALRPLFDQIANP